MLQTINATMDMTVLIIAAIVALVLYIFGQKIYTFYLYRQKLNKLPGPNFKLPFFGLPLAVMRIKPYERLEYFKDLADQFPDGYIRVWLGYAGFVHIHKPEHLETILRNNTQITKSMTYDYLYPWLGRGLLTSTGTQWHHDRKLITPAFHFKILEEFSEVMIDKAAILIKCIEKEMQINGEKPFEIFELNVRCTLDIICETAMGVNVHAQEELDSDYTKAVSYITTTAVRRFFQPWLAPDWIFYKTSVGKRFLSAVQISHDLCTRVIKRKQRERKLQGPAEEISEENELIGQRKRKAFLDSLLEANEKENNPLSLEDIRDQTNTFMFAGHDTTAALVSWTIFCLGNEMEIQKRVHEELDDILGDADERTTLEEIPNLKYLERVIKEVLRLYPSAPVVSRCLVEDLQIGKHVVPKDTTVSLLFYQLHLDPSVWPDPQRFDPDRFLPENVKTRHPYAYLPFSAGPRNCIGQKYAMLEAKIMLAQILRNFSVKSVESYASMKMESDVILRPVNGIYVHMEKRLKSK